MPEETKRERFVRVAENRTNKIIKLIDLLGNCSNKSTYEYTDDDIKQIFDAIEKELSEAKRQFKTDDTYEQKFQLKRR